MSVDASISALLPTPTLYKKFRKPRPAVAAAARKHKNYIIMKGDVRDDFDHTLKTSARWNQDSAKCWIRELKFETNVVACS